MDLTLDDSTMIMSPEGSRSQSKSSSSTSRSPSPKRIEKQPKIKNIQVLKKGSDVVKEAKGTRKVRLLINKRRVYFI